jgi:hypothetical protein
MDMRFPPRETEQRAGAAAGHLSDADLLRHLDGEPPLSAARDLTAHLRECGVCTARADLLHHRRRRLADLLAGTDVTAAVATTPGTLLERARRNGRGRGARAPALRAAAMLLVAGTLAAQPAVRRWIGHQWARATGDAPVRAPIAAPVAPAIDARRSAPGTVLAFEPGAGPFTIHFDARPSAGSLVVVGDGGRQASVERVAGENLEVLVMPHGVHVRNANGGAVSYRVRVPRSVTRVRVRFGTAPSPGDVVLDVGGEEQRITFGGRVPG